MVRATFMLELGKLRPREGKAASQATQCASIRYSVNPSLFLTILAGRVPPGMLQGT